MLFFIGSCCQTDVGVGTLLKWREDELEEITVDRDDERGSYLITETSGQKYFCYDLIVLDPVCSGELEQLGFDSDDHFRSFLKDMELQPKSC